MTMIRLAYASEAAFESKAVGKVMEPTIAQILATSRRNNARNQLTGGLYYGGDRFFQYLEGEEDKVRETYRRILDDDRHRHIVTLIDEPLEEPTMTNWSMKYVPLSSDMRLFLEEEGLEAFDPTLFSARQCEAMIEVIRNASNAAHSFALPVKDEPGESAAMSFGLKLGLVFSGLCLLAALVYTGLIL